MTDWYEQKIEEPLRELVKLLRNNGFNTMGSCGHLPRPNIKMEWYSTLDIDKLYNLLIENDYTNFILKAIWHENEYQHNRCLVIEFTPPMPFVNVSTIRKERRLNKK